MDRRADVIKRLSDEDPGDGLFELACIGDLIERAEFEAWLASKAEAHLLMQTVGDLFSPDEEAQMQMLADLSDALNTTGQMRRSA
jgi:hypothetical protein